MWERLLLDEMGDWEIMRQCAGWCRTSNMAVASNPLDMVTNWNFLLHEPSCMKEPLLFTRKIAPYVFGGCVALLLANILIIQSAYVMSNTSKT